MSLSRRARLHIRPGRPRLARARRPDGKADGERPADIVAVAKAQRIARGAPPDDALNYLYESTIGTLYRRWQRSPEDPAAISQEQFHAAQAYRGCVAAYCRLVGIPSPHPRAHDWLMVGAGLSCESDPAPQVVTAIKGKFRNARRTLIDCGAALGVGSRINAIVYAVVIEDRPIESLGRDEIQNLRCGLNALARVFR